MNDFSDEMNEVVMDGPSFMPAFAGDSFLVRRSLGRSVKNVMKINIVFYSSQPNGAYSFFTLNFKTFLKFVIIFIISL